MTVEPGFSTRTRTVSETIETEVLADLDLEFAEESTEGIDPRWIDLMRVTLYCEITLESIEKRSNEDGTKFKAQYVQALQDAHEQGRSLLDRDDASQLREDMDAIDPDSLREVRATLAYVAPHFGVDLSLPDLDGGAA